MHTHKARPPQCKYEAKFHSYPTHHAALSSHLAPNVLAMLDCTHKHQISWLRMHALGHECESRYFRMVASSKRLPSFTSDAMLSLACTHACIPPNHPLCKCSCLDLLKLSLLATRIFTGILNCTPRSLYSHECVVWPECLLCVPCEFMRVWNQKEAAPGREVHTLFAWCVR
jgi:hypothetical protein